MRFWLPPKQGAEAFWQGGDDWAAHVDLTIEGHEKFDGFDAWTFAAGVAEGWFLEFQAIEGELIGQVLNGVAEDLDGLARLAIETAAAMPRLRGDGVRLLDRLLGDLGDLGERNGSRGKERAIVGCSRHGGFLPERLIGGIVLFFR
jgi:hypothetical protein